MPFKSSKQRAYLFAKKPEVAEKFMKHEKSEGKQHERKEKHRRQVKALKRMLK